MLKRRRICQVRVSASWLLLLMLVPLFGLSACQPQETDLPFETIEQKQKADMGPPYEAREPGLIIIARPEEVANLDNWVTEDAKAQLRILDYDAYFALAMFQGWKPTDGYGIQVERITRQGDKVTVFVRLQEPRPEGKKNDIVTSPYHLVRVQKAGTWARDITFNVVVDGTVIVSARHGIP